METGQKYIGNQDAHETFSEVLRFKVFNGKIGQWKKIKGKIKHE